MTKHADADGTTGDASIIAGVGFSSSASAADIAQAVRIALHKNDCEPQRLIALASVAAKRHSDALRKAADDLDVELILVEGDVALSVSSRGLTHSQISIENTGLPSACEAAALAASGVHGHLLAPRLCHGPVTCALAVCDRERLRDLEMVCINERKIKL